MLETFSATTDTYFIGLWRSIRATVDKGLSDRNTLLKCIQFELNKSKTLQFIRVDAKKI